MASRQNIEADILALRSIASLSIGIHDLVMVNAGLNDVVIRERRQAQILRDVYEGVVTLAQHLDEDWERALRLTRDSIGESLTSASFDGNMLSAYSVFMRQTEHLAA